jgi:2-polyprenyl-6-methoxyphenol hydroxylase-like FAD-dependent oxidoreductase
VTQPLRVLISGASVAGPTAALWLARHGCAVTVVERMPLSRVRTSGHAVDLFGPAMDVVEWAGVLPAVMDARTRTEVVSFQRAEGRGVDLNMKQLVAGISSRHVEVMRGELAAALYDASRDDVNYVFEDSISTLEQRPDGVEVTFDRAASDRFDVVVGADGLHSNVRRLVIGEEDRFTRFLGGYLAIFVLPDYYGLGERMLVHNAPGRIAALYPVRQSGMARAGFLFRSAAELPIGHRDVAAQKRYLHDLYQQDRWEVPRLLAEMDAADDFYFDSITQVIMDSWSSGRATLVGDAAYSPGPAVGGGTSLAMVGAYVLACEITRAGTDVDAGFRAYEDAMRDCVVAFRGIGPSTMRTLIPRTSLGARSMPRVLEGLTRLPPSVLQRLSGFQATPARALTAVRLSPPSTSWAH